MSDRPVDGKLDISLTGVPETLLWPLYFRFVESRRDPAFFSDPLGEAAVNRINFDFSKFGHTNAAHAIRAKFADELIKAFLARHPASTVIALGEGLETQFWRVDNGSINWLSVDLPEAIELRQQLLPRHPRNRLCACSAFDVAWLDHVDVRQPVFVTAAGLFMYFERESIHALLCTIAKRIPGAEIFFDTVPPWLSRRTERGWRPTSRYQTPLMPFGIKLSDIGAFISSVPDLRLNRAVAYSEPYPHKLRLYKMLCLLPWIQQSAPALVHAEVKPAT